MWPLRFSSRILAYVHITAITVKMPCGISYQSFDDENSAYAAESVYADSGTSSLTSGCSSFLSRWHYLSSMKLYVSIAIFPVEMKVCSKIFTSPSLFLIADLGRGFLLQLKLAFCTQAQQHVTSALSQMKENHKSKCFQSHYNIFIFPTYFLLLLYFTIPFLCFDFSGDSNFIC